MQGKFRGYNLTTTLAKKYSHSTYLVSSIDGPEQQVILIVYSSSLFSSLQERKTFLQKALRLKELQHPHILPILDMGIEAKQPFVVRDHLPNGSLRSYLKQLSSRQLELYDALHIVLQVGEALAYAHQYGIFHGNLKPENILFDADGQAVLTDFHLVSRKDAIIRDQTSEEYAFCYMAPEQFAEKTDAGSDQYALGCLTYELITGQLPFNTQSLASMMGQPNYVSPTPLSEHVADLPPSLEAAILKTLARDPAERFFDFSLFLEVIRSILSPHPVSTLSHSTTSHNWNASSYPRHPLKAHSIFPSSHSSATFPYPTLETSETSASPNDEYDLAESAVNSLEYSASKETSINLIDNSFNNLPADSLPANSSLEQEHTESSITHGDEVHGLETEEMTIPVLNSNGRGISPKSKTQRNRRKIFWLVPFGCMILALVIVAWNSKTAFLPVKESTPNVFVDQNPTQVTTQSLIPIAKSNPSNTAATQAQVPSPSTAPTTQTPMPNPSATSSSSHPTPSSSPKPTPTPTPQTTTVDDSVMGTGLNQFNYVGSGWQHGQQCPGPNCHGTPPYNNTNSWDTQANDYVTVRFSGIQIKLYVLIDVPHGIGAVSIDGGTETMIDFYSSTREGNQLLWTSPTLPAGTHTFKLRVTGNKNPNASNTAVVPDRVDILG